MSYPSIQSLLKKYDIKPKKRLGQNFLIAQPTAVKIVESLKLSKNDIVLEIGPGLGVLTNILVDKSKSVFAVDTDKRMIEILKTELADSDNLHLINEDILDLDIGCHCERSEAIQGDRRGPKGPRDDSHTKNKIKVIGNIPYNITSPIIFKLIENKKFISGAILMMQKEVAQRLVSKPNSKDYGILSILVQVNCVPKKLFNITPQSFIPKPKVTSTVVFLDFETKSNYQVKNYDLFSKLVKTAFQKRRKTIKNALSSLDGINTILDKAKIEKTLRPENLQIIDFIRLSEIASRSNTW